MKQTIHDAARHLAERVEQYMKQGCTRAELRAANEGMKEALDSAANYGEIATIKGMDEGDAVEGVVHHYANTHYICTNTEQLNARLRQFDQDEKVKIFIVKAKED